MRLDLQQCIVGGVFSERMHAHVIPPTAAGDAIRRKVPLSRKREFGMTSQAVFWLTGEC
jgi:hypothetical protein